MFSWSVFIFHEIIWLNLALIVPCPLSLFSFIFKKNGVPFSISGFKPDASPEYSSGAIKTVLTEDDRHQTIIKCGSETGIRRGFFEVNGTCVQLSEFTISLDTIDPNTNTNYRYYAKQQYEIVPPAGRPFADIGDSGSFVFLIDKNNELQCIGMLIGVTGYFSGIVTPIGEILDAFQIPHQNVETFQSKKMDQ